MTKQKLEVQCEGKTKTIEADNADDMKQKLTDFAKENGLGRFVVKTDDGRKLAPNELGEVKSVRILRTEVAGAY